MYTPGRLVVALIAGMAIGSLLSPSASARQASHTSTDGLPYVESGGPEDRQWETLRDAGERACREALDSAVLLGRQFHELQRQFSRSLAHATGELTRDMARGMNELADRLHEMAERMERQAE